MAVQKVRVTEIAQELGAQPKEILLKASEIGITIKSVSSSVSDEEAGYIYEYITTGKVPQIASKETKSAPKKASKKSAESKGDSTKTTKSKSTKKSAESSAKAESKTKKADSAKSPTKAKSTKKSDKSAESSADSATKPAPKPDSASKKSAKKDIITNAEIYKDIQLKSAIDALKVLTVVGIPTKINVATK